MTFTGRDGQSCAVAEVAVAKIGATKVRTRSLQKRAFVRVAETSAPSELCPVAASPRPVVPHARNRIVGIDELLRQLDLAFAQIGYLVPDVQGLQHQAGIDLEIDRI